MKVIRIKNTLLIIIFLSLIVLSVSEADIIDDLKAKQAKVRSVSAQFTQEKHTKLLKKPIRNNGRFFYKQPDKIRWEYTGTGNMQVIYNGRELWIYYPDLKEADKISGMPQYSTLMHFDISRMSRDYDIKSISEKNLLKLRFIPRATSPVSLIEMEFPENASFPRSLKLTDSNKEITSIVFKDVRLNSDVPDNLFMFMPDKGVKVRERSLQ